LLQNEGYDGGYDSIQRFVKKWREAKSRNAGSIFIPLRFGPGEAYQFDWSHEWVILGGVVQKARVAHFRLCHSRHFFVVAYPRESLEMVLDAHDRAFAFFGGSCRRGIYDNMPTAVDQVQPDKAPGKPEPLVVVRDNKQEPDPYQKEMENIRRMKLQAQLTALSAPLGVKVASTTTTQSAPAVQVEKHDSEKSDPSVSRESAYDPSADKDKEAFFARVERDESWILPHGRSGPGDQNRGRDPGGHGDRHQL